MSHIKDMIMSAKTSKERKILLNNYRKQFNEDNKRYSAKFIEIPLPEHIIAVKKSPVKAYRSKDYLVQIYADGGHLRLSINRSDIDDYGDWREGISWDTLQKIKSKLGFGDKDAVEIYPKDSDVINVANMRHLFILNEPLPFIWRKD